MWLYGASGHGKVIRDILESQGRKVDGFIDDDCSINEMYGLPVLHTADNADEVIISIGENKTRERISSRLHCIFPHAAIHASAIISGSVIIGDGSVVMPGTVINTDTIIGDHCIVNTGASIDHECKIGDFAHISPGVHLCGQVHVGEGTLIGVGTSVIPCVHIGKWCVIGAGSVVVNDIPDGYLAYGNPCKLVKMIEGNI